MGGFLTEEAGEGVLYGGNWSKVTMEVSSRNDEGPFLVRWSWEPSSDPLTRFWLLLLLLLFVQSNSGLFECVTTLQTR